MKLIKFTTAVVALSVLGLSACHGGPEGTYKLDKTQMKQQMNAKIATMPKDQQAIAKFTAAMIDATNVELKIESGGKTQMTTTMPAFHKGQPAKTKTSTGTWRKDGNKVILTQEGKDTQCQQKGKKLTCASDHPNDPPMIFIKS